jgi:transposase
MGYFGKLEEKKRAIGLRKKGYSYNEIVKHVGVAKSTLSLWCRDVILGPDQLARLQKRRLKDQKGAGFWVQKHNKREG